MSSFGGHLRARHSRSARSLSRSGVPVTIMVCSGSTAAARFRAAGAIPIGKTNCPEFLANYETDNSITGRTNKDLDAKAAKLGIRQVLEKPLSDGALVAGVARLAPLGVLGAMFERALLRFLVDLGDAQLAAADHQVDLRLLAAHQRTHDLFDDAEIGERGEALRNAHLASS